MSFLRPSTQKLSSQKASVQQVLSEYFCDLMQEDSSSDRSGTEVETRSTGVVDVVAATLPSSFDNGEINQQPPEEHEFVRPTLLTDDFLNTFTSQNVVNPQTTEPVDNYSNESDPIETAGCELQRQETADDRPQPTPEGVVLVHPQESVDVVQLQWLENNRPTWAQSDFDALLLEVDSFKIAVPLATLGHIHPLSKELTPIFGQAPWFMGLQLLAGQQCKVVNTSLFIMPEKYDEEFVRNAKYVVSIAGLSWGLAVSKVNQPIRLSPADVRWRVHPKTGEVKQRWAAGVVKDHMCVLIDIPRMGQMLIDSNKT